MPSLLDQPLRSLVHATDCDPRLTPVAEALVARVAVMTYELLRAASPAAVTKAAAAGSNAALLGALADLLVTENPARSAWTDALLRGHVALARRLEDSGGVWGADQAIQHLGTTQATLENWREQRRVIALQRDDGSLAYPVGQFQRAISDTARPLPYRAILTIGEIVGGRLTTEELVTLLATPQEALENAEGRARTSFEALADGADERVLDFIRWVVTPADEMAPRSDRAHHQPV